MSAHRKPRVTEADAAELRTKRKFLHPNFENNMCLSRQDLTLVKNPRFLSDNNFTPGEGSGSG